MSCAEPRADGGAPLALIDLGDTLCDCTGAWQQALAGEAGHARPTAAAAWPWPPALEAQRRRLMAAPGFWRTPAPRAAGLELLRLLRQAGLQPCVLTKGPQDLPHAWGDKVAWCRQHLPGVPVIVTDDKALVPGAVLVDDWLPYVARWQQRWPAGLAIVPAQPWNTPAPGQPACIRYDGRDPQPVQAALRRLVSRPPAS